MCNVFRWEKEILAASSACRPDVPQLFMLGHAAWHGLGTMEGVVYPSPQAIVLTPEEIAERVSPVDNSAVAVSRGAELAADGASVLPRASFAPDTLYSTFLPLLP